MKQKIGLHARLSGSLKRAGLALVVPATLVAAVGIVRADVPNTFADGDTLSAAKLNDDFTALDKRLAALESAAQSPAGTIVAFGGASAPAGWLPCDGTLLDGTVAKYAALYAAIGTAHGGSSTSEMFNLPDLRGRFLRGWDNGAGNDPDVAKRALSAPGGNAGDMVGTLQADEFGKHHHGLYFNASGVYTGDYWSYSGGTYSESTMTTDTGGAETRPKNVAVNYIIKL